MPVDRVVLEEGAVLGRLEVFMSRGSVGSGFCSSVVSRVQSEQIFRFT